MKNLRLHLFALLVPSSLALVACDGAPPVADGGGDGAAALTASTLFGACEEDWQCPGEGAICRKASDGYPGGFCTVPCSDRSPCDVDNVYHHCLLRTGATQSYCERRCLNGIDCRRDGYTCFGTFPPDGGMCIALCSTDEQCGAGTHCNFYSGACTADPIPTQGGRTGDACSQPSDCLSGACVPELNNSVPTGYLGGYCVSNCLLPAGFTTTSYFHGDMLPSSTCASGGSGGAPICLPATSTEGDGDLGQCYSSCSVPNDCRPGYGCLKDFPTNTGTASYPRGVCVPIDCNQTGGGTSCPTGSHCVTVTLSNGSTAGHCTH